MIAMQTESSGARRGVTLLELLVVVTLMGILSSVVVGRYGREILGDFGARSEARQLWLDLQVARSLAIRSGNTWSVVFTGAQSGRWTGYDIVEGTGNGNSGKNAVESREFPDELTVTGNASSIGFDFEGHATQSGVWDLSGPNRVWQVRVVPLSGAATVAEVSSS